MKTLVNIITREHPVAAYLFIKEFYEEGDRLLFVSANDSFDCITPLVKILNVDPGVVQRIVLRRDSDSYTYERICRTINSGVNNDTEYYVNLAGGTRYMALSVQHVFSNYHSTFFYTQTQQNLIVKTIFDNSIYDNDDQIIPIKYRMTLAEYFEAYGLCHDLAALEPPISNETKAMQMFNLFAQQQLRSSDFKILDVLREKYRGWKYLKIAEAEHPVREGFIPIPNLSKFLDFIKFTPKEPGMLSQQELDYLTGGWFEEYVYYLIKAVVKPDDMAIGVRIDGCTEIRHNNELDVSFIKNNQLYVIECKSGISSESMFNEIVYKVSALKEVLLGVDCNSYIFSLKKDPTGDLKKIATYMGITFCDYECLTREDKLRKVLKRM